MTPHILNTSLSPNENQNHDYLTRLDMPFNIRQSGDQLKSHKSTIRFYHLFYSLFLIKKHNYISHTYCWLKMGFSLLKQRKPLTQKNPKTSLYYVKTEIWHKSIFKNLKKQIQNWLCRCSKIYHLKVPNSTKRPYKFVGYSNPNSSTITETIY